MLVRHGSSPNVLLCLWYLFIYFPDWKEKLWEKSILSKNTTQWQLLALLASSHYRIGVKSRTMNRLQLGRYGVKKIIERSYTGMVRGGRAPFPDDTQLALPVDRGPVHWLTAVLCYTCKSFSRYYSPQPKTTLEYLCHQGMNSMFLMRFLSSYWLNHCFVFSEKMSRKEKLTQ